jgi:hypothetical protein
MRLLKLIITLSLIFLYSCSNNLVELENKIEDIEIEYLAGSTDCSNWVLLTDMKKYENQTDNLAHCIISIEAAQSNLMLPDTLGYAGDVIKFTGRFYKNKGFSKSCKNRKFTEIGSVFQYTQYVVIKSNYSMYHTPARRHVR